MKNKYSNRIWVAGGLILLAVTVAVIWFAARDRQYRRATDSTDANQVRPSEMDKPDLLPVAAFTVDNHPDARPQSGLSDALVVFEAVVEGGITRYLVVMPESGSLIGPVRSARNYYAEWADGFRLPFVHVGGSPEVITALARGKYTHLLNVDEFSHGELFERIVSRPAPHNVYTSSKQIQQFAAKNGWQEDSTSAASGESITSVAPGELSGWLEINFSKPLFAARFDYDVASQTYRRSLAGVPDVDKLTGRQLSPSVVVVHETDIRDIVGDDKGRVSLRTTGSGKALIFTRGKIWQSKWNRATGGQIEYSLAGSTQPVALPAGQKWLIFCSPGQLRYSPV